jgi:ABC-type transporter Mla subunit MlaD
MEGLKEVVATNLSAISGHQAQLRAAINELDQAMTAKFDHMEQAVRELLQIVRSLEEKYPPDTNIHPPGACVGFKKRSGER